MDASGHRPAASIRRDHPTRLLARAARMRHRFSSASPIITTMSRTTAATTAAAVAAAERGTSTHGKAKPGSPHRPIRHRVTRITS